MSLRRYRTSSDRCQTIGNHQRQRPTRATAHFFFFWGCSLLLAACPAVTSQRLADSGAPTDQPADAPSSSDSSSTPPAIDCTGVDTADCQCDGGCAPNICCTENNQSSRATLGCYGNGIETTRCFFNPDIGRITRACWCLRQSLRGSP